MVAEPNAKARKAPPETPRDDAPFIEAAWLYYHDGLNQAEIATRMQISRASVVNYLAEARMRGWVRVHLDSDVFQGHRLAADLCAAYGLREALVVPDDPAGPPGSPARVTRAAADWLPRLLERGDRLGVSWGETIYQMAQQVAPRPIDDLTVIQLVGSRPATRDFAAEACTSMLAQRLGGACINLHVPLLLSSTALKEALCAEPVVADQLQALAGCNKTVFASGTCDVDAHIVRAGVIAPEDIDRYRARGATGVICGRLIDAAGQPIVTDAEPRMIGVALDQMRGKEMALLVAAGSDRTAPARAALVGGYATHLATSATVAEALLALAP